MNPINGLFSTLKRSACLFHVNKNCSNDFTWHLVPNGGCYEGKFNLRGYGSLNFLHLHFYSPSMTLKDLSEKKFEEFWLYIFWQVQLNLKIIIFHFTHLQLFIQLEYFHIQLIYFFFLQFYLSYTIFKKLKNILITFSIYCHLLFTFLSICF